MGCVAEMMDEKIEIKNESIKQYYDYLVGVYNNESVDKTHRYAVSSRMEVVKNLVKIYEHGETLNFEDLTWVEMGNKLLPEEKREMLDEIIKRQRRANLRLVK